MDKSQYRTARIPESAKPLKGHGRGYHNRRVSRETGGKETMSALTAKPKAYYFYVRSGNYDQIGQGYGHWAFSDEYPTKKALHAAMNRGRQTVRARDIFAGRQLIDKLGLNSAKSIYEEILKYQPELGCNIIK